MVISHQIRWNKKFLFILSLQKYHPTTSDRETYCKLRAKIWKSTRRPEAIQIVLRRRFEFVEVGHIFFVLPSPNAVKNRSLCREYSLPRDERKIVQKGGSKAMHDSALSLKHTEDTALKLKFHLYSKTKPLLGLELWTVLKMTSEKQCRSRRKKELRWNPLQNRNQYWNRHQQAIGSLLRWNREMERHWSAKIRGPLLLPDVKIH